MVAQQLEHLLHSTDPWQWAPLQHTFQDSLCVNAPTPTEPLHALAAALLVYTLCELEHIVWTLIAHVKPYIISRQSCRLHVERKFPDPTGDLNAQVAPFALALQSIQPTLQNRVYMTNTNTSKRPRTQKPELVNTIPWRTSIGIPSPRCIRLRHRTCKHVQPSIKRHMIDPKAPIIQLSVCCSWRAPINIRLRDATLIAPKTLDDIFSKKARIGYSLTETMEVTNMRTAHRFPSKPAASVLCHDQLTRGFSTSSCNQLQAGRPNTRIATNIGKRCIHELPLMTSTQKITGKQHYATAMPAVVLHIASGLVLQTPDILQTHMRTPSCCSTIMHRKQRNIEGSQSTIGQKAHTDISPGATNEDLPRSTILLHSLQHIIPIALGVRVVTVAPLPVVLKAPWEMSQKCPDRPSPCSRDFASPDTTRGLQELTNRQ